MIKLLLKREQSQVALLSTPALLTTVGGVGNGR